MSFLAKFKKNEPLFLIILYSCVLMLSDYALNYKITSFKHCLRNVFLRDIAKGPISSGLGLLHD